MIIILILYIIFKYDIPKTNKPKNYKTFFLILLNHKLNFQAKLQVIKTMTSVDSGQHIWNSACGLLTHFTWTLMEWSYHHCYSFFFLCVSCIDISKCLHQVIIL